MGDLTRAQMATLVKFRSGNRSDMDDLIDSAVKFAYDELATSLRVPENQETAVLTFETTITKTIYASPTDIYYPISVRNETDGERLEPLTVRDYDKIKDVSTRSKPTHYVWWRNEFIFHPPNNATARTALLRYIKRLPSLTADASVSSLPREWDEVIVQGAVYRICKWLQLPEATSELQEYTLMISRRQDRVAQQATDRSNPAAPYLPPRTADLVTVR